MKKRMFLIILIPLLLFGCGWFEEMGRNNPYDPESSWIDTYSPSNGAAAVAVTAIVSVTFLRDLAEESITEETFLLKAGNTEIAGVLSYSQEDKKITFTPSANLSYSTRYTVLLPAAGIADLEGKSLLKEYIWSFTTAAAPVAPPDPEPSGSFDKSFNNTGFVLEHRDLAMNHYMRTMALQPDGKILVAGYEDSGYSYLMRYLPDGTLDPSLSGDISFPNYPGEGYIEFDGISSIKSLAIQGDGKILLAGDDGGQVQLVRLSSNGEVDSLFDGGPADIMGDDQFNGFIFFSPRDEGVSWTSGLEIRKVFSLPGGKILAAGRIYTTLAKNGHSGSWYYDLMLLRFNADGSLDIDFGGGDGCETFNYGPSNINVTSAALDSAGRIIVCGYNDSGAGLLFRFTSEGAPDTTFNGTGYISQDWGESIYYQAVAADSQGRIIVGGYLVSSERIIAARYLADGTLDTSFGDPAMNGLVELDPTGDGNGYNIGDILLDSQGRLLLAGAFQDDLILLRLTSGGSLDASFDGPENLISYPGNGYVRINMGWGSEVFRSLALQEDGKVLAGGEIQYNNTYAKPVVFRFWP